MNKRVSTVVTPDTRWSWYKAIPRPLADDRVTGEIVVRFAKDTNELILVDAYYDTLMSYEDLSETIRGEYTMERGEVTVDTTVVPKIHGGPGDYIRAMDFSSQVRKVILGVHEICTNYGKCNYKAIPCLMAVLERVYMYGDKVKVSVIEEPVGPYAGGLVARINF